jgi:hypothetical protein
MCPVLNLIVIRNVLEQNTVATFCSAGAADLSEPP